MPCRRCSNGKYRIGSGPCVYKTAANCKRAERGARASGAFRTLIEWIIDRLPGCVLCKLWDRIYGVYARLRINRRQHEYNLQKAAETYYGTPW